MMPFGRFGLFTVLIITTCALGCDQTYHPGSSSSSSGGGEVDAGKMCTWGAHGYTFPVCPAMFTSEFMGTIDGMPYDRPNTNHITGMANTSDPPYTLSMNLDGIGYLDLEWGRPNVRGQWMDVVSGELVLPEDGKKRSVNAGSKLLFSCEEYSFQYILYVDGGDLTGCSR